MFTESLLAQVIYTRVMHGESFTYTVNIPSDHSPGLFWYHPHGERKGQGEGGESSSVEAASLAPLPDACSAK